MSRVWLPKWRKRLAAREAEGDDGSTRNSPDLKRRRGRNKGDSDEADSGTDWEKRFAAIEKQNQKMAKELAARRAGNTEYIEEESEEETEATPQQEKPDEAKLRGRLLHWQSAQKANDATPSERCEIDAAKIAQMLIDVKAQLEAAKPPKKRSKEVEALVKEDERKQTSLNT